ncbi:MAG: hypothetical protein PHW04_13490 [Candidatus Wallbacteria bacterium]|nr:hypothetical protein [Candidatus Wallbacteria bacterium]
MICWIDSREKLKQSFPATDTGLWENRTPCIEVTFPSNMPFYPMGLTANYGELIIPVNLYLKDAYGVEDFSWMHGLVKLDYFCNPGLLPFKGIYTRCRINLSAKEFRTDLRFSHVSAWFYFKASIHYLFRMIFRFDFCLFLLSCISAGLAGLLLKRSFQKSIGYGVTNYFGAPGIYLAARFNGLDGENDRISSKAWGLGLICYALAFAYVAWDAYQMSIGMGDANLPLLLRIFGKSPAMSLAMFLPVLIFGLKDYNNKTFYYSIGITIACFLAVVGGNNDSPAMIILSYGVLAITALNAWKFKGFSSFLCIVIIGMILNISMIIVKDISMMIFICLFLHLIFSALKNRFVLYTSLIFLTLTFLVQAVAGYLMFVE